MVFSSSQKLATVDLGRYRRYSLDRYDMTSDGAGVKEHPALASLSRTSISTVPVRDTRARAMRSRVPLRDKHLG